VQLALKAYSQVLIGAYKRAVLLARIELGC
jgi:hypothetical protein